jgi:hypothetical protein
MTMKMTEKVVAVASLIKGRLLNDKEIHIDEADFLELGLNERDLERALDALAKRKILLSKKVSFAPSITQSTYPTKASFSSLRTTVYSVPVFFLQTDVAKLNMFLKEASSAHFSNKEPLLRIGEITISLPPQKNEHCFCRTMFRHPIGESVDWSEVYEEMTGNDALSTKGDVKKLWRSVYDAMEAVNKRVAKVGGKALFSWQENTVRRLY